MSEHQRHQFIATGDFKFAEDLVKVLLDCWKAQARGIGDFLIAPTVADKSRNFLFASGEVRKLRQSGVRRRGRLTRMSA